MRIMATFKVLLLMVVVAALALNSPEVMGLAIVGTDGQYGPLLLNGGGNTTITVKIDNFIADRTAVWEQGGATVLNLTAATTSFD